MSARPASAAARRTTLTRDGQPATGSPKSAARGVLEGVEEQRQAGPLVVAGNDDGEPHGRSPASARSRTSSAPSAQTVTARAAHEYMRTWSAR